MIIGIDGNEANLPIRVGVGQYAFNVIWALYRLNRNNTYYIYLKSPPCNDLPPTSKNWHYVVFGPQKLWTKIALPLRLCLQRQKLDLFYSPSHYSPHFSPFPTIPTIHDLGYLDTPHQFTQKDYYQLVNWTKHSILNSKHIVAVSEFTKKEINRIYNIPLNQISVAYNGVSQPLPFTQSQTRTVLSKFNLNNDPYFLYLGTLKPSKNIPFLIQAFAQFMRTASFDMFLVIAGKKGWLFDEIFKTVQKEKIEKQVIFTDYISETEKWILYQNAHATVLPSLYEGFGIPAIESMICHTPVIVSNIAAFKEVVGESGLYHDPTNLKSLVEQMENILNKEHRLKLIKSGYRQAIKFSWENSAKSLLKAFTESLV